jgi:hypothetical protein
MRGHHIDVKKLTIIASAVPAQGRRLRDLSHFIRSGIPILTPPKTIGAKVA